jgi:[acyl-carrier-protein] S-malonyltransferase
VTWFDIDIGVMYGRDLDEVDVDVISSRPPHPPHPIEGIPMTLAVVFPGQGSHRAGMAAAWEGHPAAATFDEVGRACGIPDLARLADDPTACAETAVGQPAVFAASIAAWRALTDVGVDPVLLAGHSLGELTAATAAGTLSVADGAALVGQRGRAFSDACRRHGGGMVAVLGLDAAEVETATRAVHGVVIANDNAPGQIVIAGPLEQLAEAVDRCRDAGARTRALDVEGAFHTAAMAPALVRFAAALRRVEVRTPSVPVVRGLDATVADDAAGIVRGLVDGVLATVRWSDVQRRLADEGITVLVEAGPGGVLRGLARRSEADLRALAVDAPDAVLRVGTAREVVRR